MAAKRIKVHEAGLRAVQLHVSHVIGAKPGIVRGHGGRNNVEQEARVADDHHTPMQTAYKSTNGALDAQSAARGSTARNTLLCDNSVEPTPVINRNHDEVLLKQVHGLGPSPHFLEVVVGTDLLVEEGVEVVQAVPLGV